MLKLTNKVEYGIRALLRLHLNGSLTTKELSYIELIPESFLERIMAEFKNAGIVEGKRGPKGGYYLKKKPEDIKIIEIIELLEGKFGIVKCIESDNSCSFISMCLMKGFWRKMNEQIENFLSKMTLKDIIDEMKK